MCEPSPCTSATGTTDSVNIVLRGERKRIIDDILDLFNVETSGGDVGGNQDSRRAFLERIDRLFTIMLRHIAVNTHRWPFTAKSLVQICALFLVQTENERPGHLFAFAQILLHHSRQVSILVLRLHDLDDLSDALRCFQTFGTDAHLYGLMHINSDARLCTLCGHVAENITVCLIGARGAGDGANLRLKARDPACDRPRRALASSRDQVQSPLLP